MSETTMVDLPSADLVEREMWDSRSPSPESPIPQWESASDWGGGATDLVPSLETRLGDRGWAAAMRAVSVRHHITTRWFNECVENGYSILQKTVDVDPEIRGGTPVLKGTGFTVAQTLAELAEGCGVGDLANGFDLEPESIRNMLFALSLLLQRPCQR